VSKRLKRELAAIKRSPLPDIAVRPAENEDLRHLQACIKGPKDSPYKGGFFYLSLYIRDSYPFSPPKVRFKTKIYHPNIFNGGYVCLDLLEDGKWSAAMTIETLLLSISSLLAEPNFEDPINSDFLEVNGGKGTYKEKAEEWTRRYALLDELKMFPDADTDRGDTEIKPELQEEKI